jgi:hypothetical protein
MEPTGNATNSINDAIHEFLANGIMTTSIVVGGIFLSANQEFGVKELAVGAGADLVNRRGIKINEDRARDVFAAVRLGEEGFERASVVVRFRHLGIETTVSLETML